MLLGEARGVAMPRADASVARGLCCDGAPRDAARVNDFPHSGQVNVRFDAADVDDADLGFDERRIQTRTGFRVKHHSIEIEGTCLGCQEMGLIPDDESA